MKSLFLSMLLLIACNAQAFDIAPFTTCAQSVSPQTIVAIIKVESGGHPYALHVGDIGSYYPKNKADAYKVAKHYIDNGYSVDVGLMQINSKNIRKYGISLMDALDPCKNIALGGKIITEDFIRALGVYGDEQRALLAALSAYNTGDFEAGIHSGYVHKYYR